MNVPSPLVLSWSPLLLIGCLPSFEMLNLAASCLDNKNKIPLKVITSFSAVHFAMPSSSPQLGKIYFGSMVTKSLNFLPFMYADVFLGVFIQSW